MLVAMKVLGATVLWAGKGPGATRGEQQGPRGLLRVTLKVPFITVFMIPGLNCRDTIRTEMRDDEGGTVCSCEICQFLFTTLCTDPHNRLNYENGPIKIGTKKNNLQLQKAVNRHCC